MIVKLIFRFKNLILMEETSGAFSHKAIYFQLFLNILHKYSWRSSFRSGVCLIDALSASVALIEKPVNWFTAQINFSFLYESNTGT